MKSKTTPIDLLEKTLAFFERNGRTVWTQGQYARNAKGRKASPFNPTATCFCAIGAIRHVAGGVTSAAREAEHLLNVYGPPPSAHDHAGDAVGWNDRNETSFPQIITMFRRAIKRAKAKERSHA